MALKRFVVNLRQNFDCYSRVALLTVCHERDPVESVTLVSSDGYACHVLTGYVFLFEIHSEKVQIN